MRVDFDDGEWADVTDISEIRNGDRTAVRRAATFTVNTETRESTFDGAQDDDMEQALLRRVVNNWSYPLPIPREDPGSAEKPGSLDKLTIKQYDALARVVKPHLDLIRDKEDPGKRGTDPTAGSAS